jgi:hypothetical protein
MAGFQPRACPNRKSDIESGSDIGFPNSGNPSQMRFFRLVLEGAE